jgi:hypothetical protein
MKVVFNFSRVAMCCQVMLYVSIDAMFTLKSQDQVQEYEIQVA